MQKYNKALLGIPLSSGDLQDVILQIKELHHAYKKDQRPRFVTVINSYLLAHVRGWKATTRYNPEVLKVLRNSDLNTVDSKTIQLISFLLGEPFKEKISGIKLFRGLVQALSKESRTAFLLGGQESLAWSVEERLRTYYPDLKIVGVDTREIHTKGSYLRDAEDQDQQIIDRINKIEPDVLILQLGHPKQEIWFERIRTKLKVPVTVGVGSAFSNYASQVEQTPEWIKKFHLELFYDIYKKPINLWFRYIYIYSKILFLSFPLVTFHWVNSLITYFGRKHETVESQLFISQDKTLNVIKLPKVLNEKAVKELYAEQEGFFDRDIVVLDFENVRHATLTGLAWIIEFWTEAQRRNLQVFGLDLSSDFVFLLQVHGVWDLISNDCCHTALDIMQRLYPKDSETVLFESLKQQSDTVTLSFFGGLCKISDYQPFLSQLIPIIERKNCIIDLSYCSTIDNSGFIFLLKFREYQLRNEHYLRIKNVSKTVKREFNLAKLSWLLNF